jgi:hypothetical protein
MNKISFRRGYKVVLVAAVLLLVPVVVGAADIVVECVTTGGGISCEATPAGTPLFDEDNLVPGGTVIKELEVNNSHGEACTLELDARSGDVGEVDLADRLFTVIRDVVDRYGVSDGSAAASNKTISDLFGDSPVSLGVLAANSITNYEWAVTFDVEAGNDWQDKETIFDFDVVFTCDETEGGGGGDEQDCCPGPDPTPVGGAVQGVVDGKPPGVVGALLSQFPVAGELGVALWSAKDEASWTRVMSGIVAVGLSLYLLFRAVWRKLVQSE